MTPTEEVENTYSLPSRLLRRWNDTHGCPVVAGCTQ